MQESYLLVAQKDECRAWKNSTHVLTENETFIETKKHINTKLFFPPEIRQLVLHIFEVILQIFGYWNNWFSMLWFSMWFTWNLTLVRVLQCIVALWNIYLNNYHSYLTKVIKNWSGCNNTMPSLNPILEIRRVKPADRRILLLLYRLIKVREYS